MNDRQSKVIGYCVHYESGGVLCTEQTAYLIAGSHSAIQKYLLEMGQVEEQNYTIRKTRFGEIIEGMVRGESYSFDEESYGRFWPLAKAEGLDIDPSAFQKNPHGSRFLAYIQ